MNDCASVTVIMPVRNEGEFIARSLQAVLRQDYPREQLEVVIADGMSTDGTRRIIADVSAAHPRIPVTVVDNPGKIVPTGFNQALVRARGDIIVRVDGHTVIPPDYIRQCVGALGRSGADNAGGCMHVVGEGPFGRAVARAVSSRFSGGSRYHYAEREAWVETVFLGAWPRGVFARIGLFDEEQVRNQDDEFNYRLLARGGKILLCPWIKSLYCARGTPGALWRQYYQYGYWKVRVMQKHRRQMCLRQFVPPVFVAALVVSLLGASISTLGAWVLAVTSGSYVAGTLAASSIAARREPWRVRLLVPVAFALMHVGWGVGFLVGLVRFSRRWRDRENRWPRNLAVAA